jgi:hypothetical protein
MIGHQFKNTRSHDLSKANICQKPIVGKSQYLAKANIWQKQIFGKKTIFGKVCAVHCNALYHAVSSAVYWIQ